MLIAVLFDLLMLSFFIYTPGVQHLLGVDHPPAFVWIFCLPVWSLLFVFNEGRKYFIRNWPKSRIVHCLKW
ncbi:hypothetical protein AB6A40_006889 [Gnathostoma spinigerum]|uniref:Cation-transporting P-type ATPase C-terminal domain-containing protein n=1 Tax=Gnathostoma spinigerum TaxID=75299 RepID=A0ABD6EJN0_9BILA